MKQTYSEAITRVFQDEGGYTNDPSDHGGATNWGITIADARSFWKRDATPADVKAMPKSVAENIYRSKYADRVNYDNLDAGVDYAVLDYAINSGISRSLKVLKEVQRPTAVDTINAIYDEREAFLNRLSQRPGQDRFRKGWLSRTKRGRALALSLNTRYGSTLGAEHGAAGAIVVSGGTAAAAYPHLAAYIIAGTIGVALLAFTIVKLYKGNQNG